MTGGAVSHFQADFIHIVFARFQELSCHFHFVVKEKAENRISIDLFEAFLEFFQAEAYFGSQFNEGWRFGHPLNDNILGLTDPLDVFLIHQEGALFCLRFGVPVEVKGEQFVDLPLAVQGSDRWIDLFVPQLAQDD